MFYGWRVVSGVFVSQMFVVGFFNYAVSLLTQPVREEFGVSLEQVMHGLTIGTLLGLISTPLIGVLVDRVSLRWLMTGGMLFLGSSLWVLAQTNNITQYVIVFGVSFAFSMSLVGPLTGSAVISRWFTASRGRALGVAAIGTSVGGAFLPALLSWWIAEDGWRAGLENLALLIMIPGLVFVMFTIRGWPAEIGLYPEAESEIKETINQVVLNLSQIIKTPTYWYMGLSVGLLLSSFLSILSNITPYATMLGHSKEEAFSLIIALASAGLVGKIAFGYSVDRFSSKVNFWVTQMLVLIGFIILSTEPAYSLMIIAVILMGFATGGIMPVWGVMLVKAFGLNSFGRAMGAMGALVTLCIMPGYSIVGRIFDTTGSYSAALWLLSGVVLLCALLLIPLKLEKEISISVK